MNPTGASRAENANLVAKQKVMDLICERCQEIVPVIMMHLHEKKCAARIDVNPRALLKERHDKNVKDVDAEIIK